jgi:hypothetical protein
MPGSAKDAVEEHVAMVAEAPQVQVAARQAEGLPVGWDGD